MPAETTLWELHTSALKHRNRGENCETREEPSSESDTNECMLGGVWVRTAAVSKIICSLVPTWSELNRVQWSSLTIHEPLMACTLVSALTKGMGMISDTTQMFYYETRSFPCCFPMTSCSRARPDMTRLTDLLPDAGCRVWNGATVYFTCKSSCSQKHDFRKQSGSPLSFCSLLF